VDECILHFTWLCGRAVSQTSDSLNLVVSLAGGSIEISDFRADVKSRAPLNYTVFTRQVQLGQGIISGGITVYYSYTNLNKVICPKLQGIAINILTFGFS